MNNDEIWKDIEGYEGLYQISNLGRVKSFIAGNGYKKERIIILKSFITSGYMRIAMSKNLKQKHFLIHRLVALHFINNVKNKKEINHIDGNKLNNYYQNLEWVSPKENIKHAIETGLKKFKTNKIYQIDKDTNEIIKEWKNANEIYDSLGICKIFIRACCRGKNKTAKGFKWVYVDSYNR